MKQASDDDSVVESLSLLFLFGKLKNQYNFWHVIDHFHINFDYNVFTHANHPNDLKHFKENSVKALCFQTEVTLTVEVFHNSKTLSWAFHKEPVRRLLGLTNEPVQE